MHTVEIQTWDLLVTYQIKVDRSARQFVLDRETGKAHMLPFGPVGHWLYGQQNIHFVYEAGFTGSQLFPFQDAVRELISIVWREIGVHPLELVRSDNIGNNVSFTKFDPRRLPFTTQQLINNYSRLGT